MTNSSSARIFVVIVTYQRSKILAQCLHSLQNLQPLQWRLFIAVNGPDADSKEQMKHMNSAEVLSYDTPGPIADIRNHLIDKLRSQIQSGDWILFLDDDAFLPAGYGAQLMQSLQQAQIHQCAVIGGPNLTPPGSPWFAKLSGTWLASRFVAGPMSKRYRVSTSGVHHNDDALILCHLLVSESIFGLPLFKDGIAGGEENLLLQRLFREGKSSYYDGKLFVYHYRRAQGRAYFSQIWKYGFGRGQTIRHSGYVRWPHLLPVLAGLFILIFATQPEFWVPVALFYILVILAQSLLCCWLLRSFAGLWSVLGIPLTHFGYVAGVVGGFFHGKEPVVAKHRE